MPAHGALSSGSKHFCQRHSGPGFVLGTWTCSCTHERPGPEQGLDRAVINVVLRGSFVRHVGRQQVTAEPLSAILSRPGEIWRSSHLPGCSGDSGVYVIVEAELSRGAERRMALSGPSWLDWARLAREDDPERSIELTMALSTDLLDSSSLPAREPPYVTRARRILAEHRRDPPPLTALAEELHVSPWHLCRAFRAATGSTPRAYAERLTLAEVASRLAEYPTDLATLAVEQGFSSHSHLTARFKALFGCTPSALSRTART